MDTKTRTTRQGIRDLNFYGVRVKVAKPDAADPLAVVEPGAPDAPEVPAELTVPAPVTTIDAVTTGG